MRSINYGKILPALAFLALAFFSCNWTASSFYVWQPDMTLPGAWFLAIALYVIASICFSLIWKALDKNVSFRSKIMSRGTTLLMCIVGFLVFWMFSLLTNTHYLIYKSEIKKVATDELNSAKYYLNDIAEGGCERCRQRVQTKAVDFKNCIEFRNVSFKYGDKYVLKDINLKIEKGRTVALVGQSGSGKSTMVDLLPRFWDVQEGEILIDGVNIKNYKLYDLRNLMGNVNQESILFNDTIRNNITFGVESATDSQVEAAAKVANALEFITEKEGGYQANVGDRGGKLSGGQRQRLSIARAVLKNPPIMILDEATSALDTESERLVQDALTNLMKNRTSIVIAHRLSTVKDADEICVLSEGRIIERGTHNQLIELNGTYKKLCDLQTF